MTKFAAAILALFLCALCSCTTPAPSTTGRLVDPVVTQIAADGKTAKVNVGAYDGIHAGQRLYVVRQNKLIGMLAVRTMDAYSSDCLVVASHETSKAEAKNVFGSIHAGDNVFRSLSGLTKPEGMAGEQVPRMVPVPYEPEDPPAAEQDSADNAPDKTPKLVLPPSIPRDEVDDWIKKHPELKTN